MSERTEKHQEKLRAQLAERLPGERILAVGGFTRGGTWGSMGAMMAGGLIGELAIRKTKKAAGGLPPNVALAVTPTKVHVFGHKPGWRGTKYTKAAEWDRASIRVEAGESGMTDKIRVEFRDGGAVELEQVKFGGASEFNRDAIRLLQDPAAS